MNLKGLLLIALLGMTGCIGESAEPQPDFPADSIIEADTLKQTFGDEAPTPETIDTEDLDSETDTTTVMTQPLVGEPARSVGAIRNGLAVANAMLIPALDLLQEITANEPVGNDRGVRVWTYEKGAAFFTFFLDDDDIELGRYNYTLLVRAADTDASNDVPFLTGFFIPGRRALGERQTGIGLLRYNYDQTRLAGLTRSSGKGTVGFRVTPLKQHLFLNFKNFKARPSATPLNARHRYRLNNDRTGTFAFQLVSDLTDDLDGPEILCESAVWGPTLRGRAFTEVVSSQDNTVALALDECWDANLDQVWTEWSPGAPSGEANDGNVQACDVFERLAPAPLEDCAVPVGDDEDAPIPPEDG